MIAQLMSQKFDPSLMNYQTRKLLILLRFIRLLKCLKCCKLKIVQISLGLVLNKGENGLITNYSISYTFF